jgi:twitching motility protein PilI
MANREALRDLQSRLASRLQAARGEGSVQASWLAVEAAGHKYLFPLTQSGEIFPFTTTQSVPYTHSWFLGVANLRGGLHGVVDLAGFLGLKSQAANEFAREQLRLIAFNPVLEINCAMLVDKLSGLRSREQLEEDADEGRPKPGFVGGRYRDSNGRVWQELRLAALAGDESFLKIVG